MIEIAFRERKFLEVKIININIIKIEIKNKVDLLQRLNVQQDYLVKINLLTINLCLLAGLLREATPASQK